MFITLPAFPSGVKTAKRYDSSIVTFIHITPESQVLGVRSQELEVFPSSPLPFCLSPPLPLFPPTE